MNRAYLIFILYVILHSTLSFAYEFQGDDYVLILIEGNCNQSSSWGVSGKASMYVYSPNSMINSFHFSKVIDGVALERRSAKKTTPLDKQSEIKYDYSNKANIPPGIYTLHYHRFDDSSHENLTSGRPRLGLADNPCIIPNETNEIFDITSCCNSLAKPWDCCQNTCYSYDCDETIRVNEGTTEYTRCFIQFHVAYNNLNEYRSDTNEGCIVLNEENFHKLFPFSFLYQPSTPLIRHIGTGLQYESKGRVLVFVSDLTFNKVSSKCERQSTQIDYFENLLNGKLNDNHFRNTSERQKLKEEWAPAPEVLIPKAPTGLRVIALGGK